MNAPDITTPLAPTAKIERLHIAANDNVEPIKLTGRLLLEELVFRGISTREFNSIDRDEEDSFAFDHDGNEWMYAEDCRAA